MVRSSAVSSSWNDPDFKTREDTFVASLTSLAVQRFALTVLSGPQAGNRLESTGERLAIGVHPANDLRLEDARVSRFHVELRVDARGVRVRDLGSRNGVFIDGVRVESGWIEHGSTLRIGKTLIRYELLGGTNRIPLSTSESFGGLYGASPAMRALFAVLERVAPTDTTVLLEGETGTGKEEAAHAIHEASPRREGPFVVLDCSAVPPNLIESELFGHERGAFTGAEGARTGLFEEANGGTLFLDELGELRPDVQPALLRVLEQREVRRVGGTRTISVDVRLVAATNRDLREEVTAGRFREDLFYRLAVVHARLPPLRERIEDLPALADLLLRRMGLDDVAIASVLTPELVKSIALGRWPGNVRELRNYLERCVVLGDVMPVHPVAPAEPSGPSPVDARMTYADARTDALARFERDYAAALLALHDGNVSAAARAAGLARPYLHRLLRRHGLR
ncbi:MAG: sigma 54-dependent Fis family transcriptional regulator [Myxococcales bacterium]|nr:sigma 54-dependent Fis family transcriptional regulator [Myxococcales bacterium]